MATQTTTVDWSALYHGTLTWVPQRTIFLTRAGSHAYGLATPTSDLDLRGIVIPPKEYFLGFWHQFAQAESLEPDLVIYDIRKFFHLAACTNIACFDLGAKLQVGADNPQPVYECGPRQPQHATVRGGALRAAAHPHSSSLRTSIKIQLVLRRH